MRAATYSEYGNPETLSITEAPRPKVAPGTVLIKVHRAAVNPVDWKLMAGWLDELMDTVFPVTPGWDVSGVIAEVGPDVPEFSVGDRVASYARKDFVHGGTFAEYVTVPATSVAQIPDGVDDDVAAGLPLTGLTALRSLEALDITADDTVLIHGASGGVGHLAAQMALNLGATVIGTASETHHEELRAFGVIPVTYGEGLEDRVTHHAQQGITAVVDCVGGVLEQSLALLPAREGSTRRLVSIADPTVEEHGGRWIWVRPDGARLRSLLQSVAEGQLTVTIDRAFPLEAAGEALAVSKAGEAHGKLIIEMGS